MKLLKLTFILGVLFFSNLVHSQTTVIKNATIHIKPGTRLENATLVIKNGRVANVGKAISAPKGATIIDAQGKIVTAGFIDSYSRVGLVEVDMVNESTDGSFSGGNGIHASYSVLDGYNPNSITIDVARTGGVTSVIASPQGGLISGLSAWMSLDALHTLDDLVIQKTSALHLTLGKKGASYTQKSRGKAIEKIREIFDDTQFYTRQKRQFNNNQTRLLSASRLDLEHLSEVLKKRTPLMIAANRSSDIQSALRLGQSIKLPIVILGGAEAWMVAKEIKAANAAVITSSEQNLPINFDSVHANEQNISILQSHNVPVALASMGEASNTRILRQLAGISVTRGSSWDQALASITTIPAKIFNERRGTLEKNQPADVVIWSGDPFELSTHAEKVFINGKNQSLKNHQTLLLDRYRKLNIP